MTVSPLVAVDGEGVDSGVDVTDMFTGTQCGPTCGVTFDCP